MHRTRRILVTSALPYANGAIHIGHMLEHIQADIWIRAMRMQGHEVHFVCADDTHGTPVMLRAEQESKKPEALIAEMRALHMRDFEDFAIAYDHYGSTNDESNRQLTYEIWHALGQSGNHSIESRSIEQFYDPVRQMFLPDRYVKGECPNCATKEQYGDACENCGATYAATELKNPFSVLSGAAPELKQSEHYFVKLENFRNMLESWLAEKKQSGGVQAEVYNKLQEWLKEPLRDWDISRDAPYFGFNIPGHADKFFYVWLDAPIGYLSSFKDLCEKPGNASGLQARDFDAFAKSEQDTELVHFIGKDIIYFHTLFWPAVLAGAGFRKPSAVYTHGFLTVDGQKMSKSRGTFITARTYLDKLQPDFLRYYFASMLGPSLADVDLDLKAFEERVNSHLVGKFVNIASRCAGLLQQHFGGRLCSALAEEERLAYQWAIAQLQACQAAYESRDYAFATRRIMEVADFANEYIAKQAPWKLAKQSENKERLLQVLSQGINLFRALACYLKPVIPHTIAKAEKFLAHAPFLRFEDVQEPLLDHAIGAFEPLMTRIEAQAIASIITASQESLKPMQEAKKVETKPDNANAHIGLEDFGKIDLRVAKVLQAEIIPEADKLLKLQLDLGTETRQVFAGIKQAYDPSTLIGRHIVMIANLAPRKMRFGVSEGMVLAASNEQGGPFLLSPDSGAVAGMKIK